jgi:transcriptional regulator with XRE-family HTH domain
MVLLRRVIGDALRARRQGQHRTLREVSSVANVSLGYLSEIERGQKEASSELLAAICDALGARLSELLREVSDTVELAEQVPGVLLPVQDRPVAEPAHATPAESGAAAADGAVRTVSGNGVRRVAADDGKVSVSVRQDSPLKATLRATRRVRSAPHDRDRDVVCVG